MRTATSQTHIATVVFENWDAGRKVAISDRSGTLIKEIFIRDPKAEWHPSTVLSFSPSGKYLAIGSVAMESICQHPLRILDCQTWEFKQVDPFWGVRDPVIYGIKFSADEKHLIFKVDGTTCSGGSRSTVKCFEMDEKAMRWMVVDDPRAQQIIQSNQASCLSMAISATGSALYATGSALSSLASWGSSFFVRPANSASRSTQHVAEQARTESQNNMKLD